MFHLRLKELMNEIDSDRKIEIANFLNRTNQYVLSTHLDCQDFVCYRRFEILCELPFNFIPGYRGPILWRWLIQVLKEPGLRHIVSWVNENDGTFYVVDFNLLAKLWAKARNNNFHDTSASNLRRLFCEYVRTGRLQSLQQSQGRRYYRFINDSRFNN